MRLLLFLLLFTGCVAHDHPNVAHDHPNVAHDHPNVAHDHPNVAHDHPNVLFIMVDDLRPALGSYGDSVAITPYMDGLARSGVKFERAFAQVCGYEMKVS